MRVIDADELHAEISKWPESVMYKDWVQSAIANAPTIPAPQWISVEDGMPPEHDSIFKKHKGTSKWLAGMYETISDDVNVVLRFEDGTEKVYTSHTTDGVWRKLPIIGRPTVTIGCRCRNRRRREEQMSFIKCDPRVFARCPGRKFCGDDPEYVDGSEMR